jgi:hypothetical protein
MKTQLPRWSSYLRATGKARPVDLADAIPPRDALFRQQLRAEVKRIQTADASDGTTARGVDCLFSALNWRALSSAPVGTNAAWVIKQAIRDLADKPGFAGYILP